MNKIILPYRQDIAKGQGCYITKEGEFIDTKGSHGTYAYEHFCNDKEYLSWISFHRCNSNAVAEYAVLMRNYDRLRTIGTRQIQTSEKFLNTRFFNWILMDWPIIYMPALTWDDSIKKYVPKDEDYDEYRMYTDIEETHRAKIKEIKSKVLISDRSRYFI